MAAELKMLRVKGPTRLSTTFGKSIEGGPKDFAAGDFLVAVWLDGAKSTAEVDVNPPTRGCTCGSATCDDTHFFCRAIATYRARLQAAAVKG